MKWVLCVVLAGTGLEGIACGQASEAKAAAGKPAAGLARLNNLGVAWMNQQHPDKALEYFEQAHRADPQAFSPLLNRGIALLYLRRLPEAESTLRSAAGRKTDDPRPLYCLGLALMSDGDDPGALAFFEQAAALDPREPDARYFIASIALRLKQYDKAIASFQQALRLNPLHASAEFGFARALQGQGKGEAAHAHLLRFQEITAAKNGTVMGSIYGEQGRDGLVQPIQTAEPAVGPMIPVRYVLGGRQAAVHGVDGQAICILDLKGKNTREILTVGEGTPALHAWRAEADALAEVDLRESGLALSGSGVACATGDFDNDGQADLAVAFTDRVMLFRNLGGGKFQDVTNAAGLGPKNKPAGLTFVDFDHDGDLDLLITGSPSASHGSANVLWRNNGNGTFTEWTAEPALGGDKPTRAAALSDLNNDRAVDLIVTGDSASPTLYLNQREGAFKQTGLYPTPYQGTALPATRGVAVLDFDKDGFMDVAVTHTAAPGLTLWRSLQGARHERVTLPFAGVKAAWGLTPVDFDNDGWVDLAFIAETDGGTRLRVLRNRGPQGFEDVSAALGLDAIALDSARSLVAVRLSSRAVPDFVVGRAAGPPLVLWNRGAESNHALLLTMTGLADNKSAFGAKVEVFAGELSQKFEVASSSGFASQGPAEIIAGLGGQSSADIVRLLWPTGVPQDEIDVSAAKPVALDEIDRRGSSCPVLFAWNGTKYEFIGDVIGAAVVGHWISPTERNIADPDEWVKVDGSSLKPRNGLLSLRFGEPMEEVNYIDRVRLMAVDHPEGTEVYPDERFLSEPPFASGRVVVASPATRVVAGAWDDKGKDVLAQLSLRDRQYVHDFKVLGYAGFTTPHTLTLDLGPWTARNPLRLFLYGYIEYFSASSMYAASQAGLQPEAPSLEEQLPDGSWRKVIDDAGFPAGLARMIVMDLTGKLSPGARRVRLKTNLQIYWDQVLVDNGPEMSLQARQTELPLATAHLAFRGYPRQMEGASPGDLTYDYQQVSATGPFLWARGSYTRHGEVAPLLGRSDDHYVIFGSGEEVDAEFRADALPVLPPHWKRDYFFYADGFVKDMDFYEASPFTVSQMPFHGMSGYPYPRGERKQSTPEDDTYNLQWNDRFESGERLQKFGFNYQPVVSQPTTNKRP